MFGFRYNVLMRDNPFLPFTKLQLTDEFYTCYNHLFIIAIYIFGTVKSSGDEKIFKQA